ncbi:hypothetical protein D3I60_04510 [Brevibacterium permense]|nr:hypothetical protein [Brevibacterium permense]
MDVLLIVENQLVDRERSSTHIYHGRPLRDDQGGDAENSDLRSDIGTGMRTVRAPTRVHVRDTFLS